MGFEDYWYIVAESRELTASSLLARRPDEAETLAIYALGNVRARLACQIHICANLRVRKIPSA
jgi:hypothetical protein